MHVCAGAKQPALNRMYSFQHCEMPHSASFNLIHTLLLHKQVSLHRVLAHTFVIVWILLHLPHQTLHL